MSLSKSTEITGSNRSKSFSTPAHSPQLITPNNTPPHSSFAEQRLQQLLMNCEAGTHSFHRDDGDDYTPSGSVPGPVLAAVAGDMRRKSFAGGEGVFHPLFHLAQADMLAVGQQRPGRRPSFLSSLSLSRPFSFTPSQPSSPATQPSHHHNLPSGLSMTSSHPNSIASSPTVGNEIDRAQSTPPHLQHQALQQKAKPEEMAGTAMSMQRSKTQPPTKVHGFNHGFGLTSVQPAEERRHFDPGREPKLLGLL
jgi:hypothetical protein